MNGFAKIVELLIEKGANVNIQTDPQKYAPIHSASFGRHLETIKVLVNNGAEMNYQLIQQKEKIKWRQLNTLKN